MFITADQLREYKACKQGIEYIERFYPNGAELIDIIRDKHIPKEMLHWGRMRLTVSEEEFEEYCKACNIVNSESFWASQNVSNSKYVVNSKDIKDCRGAFDSNDIANSIDIVNSDSVLDSVQIFYSSMVDASARVFKSRNVTNGTNICNSTMIARSKSVVDSFNVFDSSEIIDSENVSNSHFCQGCKDIKYCLFCQDLENAEYHIFNRPVDKSHYEIFEKQYLKYMTEELDFVRNWPSEMLRGAYISVTRKFDDWYHPISPKFWKWARTLPHYDSMLLYYITMMPELLIDEE